MVNWSKRTVIETDGFSRLVHRTAGTEKVGAGTLEASEAWGVLWTWGQGTSREAVYGRWYRTEAEARQHYAEKVRWRSEHPPIVEIPASPKTDQPTQESES